MESGAKDREVPASTNRQLALVLKHPLRARIAAKLEESGMGPLEMAETLDESLSRTDYHYAVLVAVGLVDPADDEGDSEASGTRFCPRTAVVDRTRSFRPLS